MPSEEETTNENISSSDINNHDNETPLDSRITEVIRNKSKFTIRPAELASELGISIDDANAELCGLLRAVGSTATFQFDSIPISKTSFNSNNKNSNKMTTVMTFTFPPDFEQKASATRRKENIRDLWWNLIHASFKIFKVFVAFGLIISFAVVMIGGMCLFIATVIAMSRGGNGNGGMNSQHHRRLMGNVRAMWFSLRQLFWVFYIGGGFDLVEGGGVVDPFIAETAFTLSMWSPSSIWFWLRMYRIRNRRVRMNRGWRTSNASDRHGYESSLDGNNDLLDINGNSHGSITTRWSNYVNRQQQDERGLLSIVVEFLFGPTPFHPGPTDYTKWKIRETFIIETSSIQQDQAINMVQFLPFVDYPPTIITESQQSLRNNYNSKERNECLKIITHFNGVPYMAAQQSSSDGNSASHDAYHFVFPELILSESDGLNKENDQSPLEAEDNNAPNSFFYTNNTGYTLSTQMVARSQMKNYLHENRYVLTKLTKSDFYRCILMNTFNFIGLLMIWNSIQDGVLEIRDKHSLQFNIIKYLLLLLMFYAKLFFILPLGRMLILLVLNHNIKTRNERRMSFAKNWLSE